MTELERLREEATEIAAKIWREEISVTNGITQVLSLKAYKGKSGEVYTLRELIKKGVIPVEQSLPPNPYGAVTNIEVFHRAVSDFVKPDLEGKRFIKVDPRE